MSFLFPETSSSSRTHDCVSIFPTDTGYVWVVMTSSGSSYRVLAHGYEPLAPDTIVDGVIVEQGHFFRACAPLRAYRNMPLIVVVPTELTYATTLPLGQDRGEMSLDEYCQSIITEYAVRSLTFPSHDVVCEYTVIDQMIVATLYQKSILETYTSIFRSLGFSSIHYESLSYVLARTYADLDTTSLCVHVGSLSTTIALMRGACTLSMTTLPIGEYTVYHIIHGWVDHDDDLARKVYRRYGILPSHRDTRLYAALEGHVTPLIDTVREYEVQSHMYQYVPRAHTSSIPTRIVITGQGASMPGLKQFLNREVRSDIEEPPLSRFLYNDSDMRVPDIDLTDIPRYAPVLSAGIDYMRTRRA